MENEHVNQARRFARFYVYRTRGYDTLEPRRNPDRIAAVALALGSLSPETLLEYLGEYYQQLTAYQRGSEPVAETPEIAASALVWLTQDVAVTLDADTTAQLTAVLTTHGVLDALEETSAGDDRLETEIRRALEGHGLDTETLAEEIGETLLAGTGPLVVNWRQNGQTTSRTLEGTGTSLTEHADARLQVFTDLYECTDGASFQQALVHHLRCQIRDCYIRIGIAPPPAVRVQGPGFYENVSWYEHLGFYEPYNDPRASITTWLEEYTPDDFSL
ncbi:hypothetical protein [Natronobiforma cellulositropha]|uniref:hypothetical protein n=1 Tax=Natronobiforma cellulositropha TaxID=1679076 RepID=UPI0021D5FFF2|nr:hypothetical protein [Natronobiforma cellulositropha]